jgi:hypothetical protein
LAVWLTVTVLRRANGRLWAGSQSRGPVTVVPGSFLCGLCGFLLRLGLGLGLGVEVLVRLELGLGLGLLLGLAVDARALPAVAAKDP